VLPLCRYVAQALALRLDETAPSGRALRTLTLSGVSVARWEALTRCATMSAWQAAVARLLAEAHEERRVHALS
jgi:hypothetical protein